MFALLDTVVLNRDLPEHGLRRGDLGAIVEMLGPDVYEVEFADLPPVVVRIGVQSAKAEMMGALYLSGLLKPRGVPLPCRRISMPAASRAVMRPNGIETIA